MSQKIPNIVSIEPILRRAMNGTNDLLGPALMEAWEAGYRQGSTDALQKIMAAAQTGIEPVRETTNVAKITFPGPLPVDVSNSANDQRRTPRGRVGELVQEVLKADPGLTIVEVEKQVLDKDPGVARKSIGNQLRTFENKKYRRRDGRYWFLMQG